jgi:ribosomal protein L40E
MINRFSTHSNFVTGVMQPSGPTKKAGSTTLDQLQFQIDRQHLVIQTLLIMLLEKGVMTEQELNEWIDYVDGLDGRRDGRLKADVSPITCSSCGRKNSPNAGHCQYCGHDFDLRIVDPRHKKG